MAGTESKKTQVPKKEDKIPKKQDIALTEKDNKPLKEVEAIPEVKKIKKAKNKRTVVEGHVYIQSTFNNTIVTITDNLGKVIAWSSAGANGFKGAKKATPYAAQISSEAAMNKALTYGVEKIHVFVKGVGSGRDQAIRGLTSSGVSIESVTDITPLPHNGCRKRKARRV